MSTKITIAITAFRRPDLLRRAVSSALATGCEVVCATGDNDPGVAKVLDEWKIRSDIHPGNDRGCNATWLAAARLVRTPLMVLLHDDDELMPNFCGFIGDSIPHALAEIQVVWDAVVRFPDKPDMHLRAMNGPGGIRDGAELFNHLMNQPRTLSPIHGLWRTAHVVAVLEECEKIIQTNSSPGMLVRPNMLVGNDLLLWLKGLENRKIYYIQTPVAICHAHSGSETMSSLNNPAKLAKLHGAYVAAKEHFKKNKIRPKLAGVTAMIIEAVKINTAAKVLDHCAKLVEFEQYQLIAPRRPTIPFAGKFIQVPVFNYIGYSTFSTKCVWRYFDTSHMMMLQWDGFITHPEMWNPEWMKYDYIGAPWPQGSVKAFAKKKWRVGNSGFSLRSHKFMQLCGEMNIDHNNIGDRENVKRTPETDECADDVWMCQRPEVVNKLLQAGMKYAPVEVAMKFSLEGNIPECSNTAVAFGFHDFRYRGNERYRITCKEDVPQ